MQNIENKTIKELKIGLVSLKRLEEQLQIRLEKVTLSDFEQFKVDEASYLLCKMRGKVLKSSCFEDLEYLRKLSSEFVVPIYISSKEELKDKFPPCEEIKVIRLGLTGRMKNREFKCTEISFDLLLALDDL